jgi:hypothetical protein
MSNVTDLLKLPCLDRCFIIAGFNGIFNIVIRMDILETSFPEVEKYLEPNEFHFTSFWNHRDDKDNRINLVKSMIKHKCAGIGIMPGINLDDKIDQEILDLADANSFPVMYIPSYVRWSDVISDFALLNNSLNKSDLDTTYSDILSAFGEFHIDKRVQKFCHQLSQFLSIPIIINADTIYSYGVNKKVLSSIVAKIYDIRIQNSYRTNSPISLHINNENLSIVYYGDNSVFTTYVNMHNITNQKLEIFHKIAPLVTKELDYLFENKKNKPIYIKPYIDQASSYYLVILRKENINSIVNFINSRYLIYEENDFYNYVILLINSDSITKDNIFSEFNKIITNTNPTLFIFSNYPSPTKELLNQIKILKNTIHSLLFLDGIFLTDELPLLYMTLNLPYQYKESVVKLNSTSMNLDIELSFFDTLRLYLVLKNIKDVSTLLGIHSNSVKYRISKCFNSFESDSSNALASLPYLKILLMLEICKVEGPAMLRIYKANEGV